MKLMPRNTGRRPSLAQIYLQRSGNTARRSCTTLSDHDRSISSISGADSVAVVDMPRGEASESFSLRAPPPLMDSAQEQRHNSKMRRCTGNSSTLTAAITDMNGSETFHVSVFWFHVIANPVTFVFVLSNDHPFLDFELWCFWNVNSFGLQNTRELSRNSCPALCF